MQQLTNFSHTKRECPTKRSAVAEEPSRGSCAIADFFVGHCNAQFMYTLVCLTGHWTVLYYCFIRCGSGLSGECLTDQGHAWVGIDISTAMLGECFGTC